MLIRKINEKNVCFVTTGIFYIKFLIFSYGPYLVDDCYNFSQKSRHFKNIAIVHIKKIHTDLFFMYE